MKVLNNEAKWVLFIVNVEIIVFHFFSPHIYNLYAYINTYIHMYLIKSKEQNTKDAY